MKKPIVLFLHLGYWFLYLLLLFVIFTIANMQIKKTELASMLSHFYLLILFLGPNIFSFYSFYFLLFPRFLVLKKIAHLMIFGILVCLITALLGSLISLFIFGKYQPIFSELPEFVNLNLGLFLIGSVHGSIALVIRGFVTWYDEIKLKEELAQKNFEMESALIRSQLNPHFLFNTVNNIDVLINKDSIKASAYLNKLSDILRYMVYETKTDKIPLSGELGYIEKYLELQKIRTTNQNYVNLKIVGEPPIQHISPMILFPFIENAFKHTENSRNTNTINVTVSFDKSRLVFDCENSYQKMITKTKDFGGLGNELILKRLNLLYPNKHSLEIADDGFIYRVRLTIDLT